ncbi:MAG: BCD family MFS transporter [Chloroflexota bacterium]
MLLKRIQLGMIHAAVAMTLVPINSTLNRVMIKELELSALLVAILASLPYVFSPIQMLIGSYSDRHPIFGFRRTPYILLGLLLCVVGVIVTPQVAFELAGNWWLGLWLGILAFGAWGMGYNFASVSYMALASEISGEKGRSKTITVMFLIMIMSMILTSLGMGRMLDPYSPQVLQETFLIIGMLALSIGVLGLLSLEKKVSKPTIHTSGGNIMIRQIFRSIMDNQQAKTFFVYLWLLLIALLGQDVLLEPFGAESFQMSVRTTTQLTSIWGGCMLVTLAVGGLLEGRFPKRTLAQAGNFGALFGFLLIAASGMFAMIQVFYLGVVVLGLGTGLSTVTNLSLMLDMTTPANVGLFIGAWGFSNALSRLSGSVMAGSIRDVVTYLSRNAVLGYVIVFIAEIVLMGVSIWLLRSIDPVAFRKRAGNITFSEKISVGMDN